MTRARIMRVKSRQKRVNQIRASFVKDARRQMRVDTRSLAGANLRAGCEGGVLFVKDWREVSVRRRRLCV